MEQIITVADLSKKLGIHKGTLSTYLCRFEKYAVSKSDWNHAYKFNYYFLLELKQFFAKKMYARNGQYFSKYHKVIDIISSLMDEM